MINLVTGYRGKAHVTADEEAARNLLIFTDFYVTTNGDQLAYNLESNNQLRILSGDLLVQGRFVRIENYEDVTIETGTQEKFRTDLICLRYTKESDTGIENMSLVAIKGTESTTAAAAPAYNEGIIADGANPVDFPLYKVELNGLNVAAVTALFTPTDSLPSLQARLKAELEAWFEEEKEGFATKEEVAAKAPAYTYGTTDIGAGVAMEGEEGALYFVIE